MQHRLEKHRADLLAFMARHDAWLFHNDKLAIGWALHLAREKLFHVHCQIDYSEQLDDLSLRSIRTITALSPR
jgi:hypothetical protein